MITLLSALLLSRPLIMAHYMPWYESKAISGQWGWHWTMNHFDPDHVDKDGNRQLASRFHPLIGLYDSSDPDTLECQTLQMKIAGIDGVFIDWYGIKDLNDYSILNRNSQKMIEACTKVGLKFSIVMEDQVVPGLIKAGKSSAEDYGQTAADWLSSRWFPLPGYLRWKGKPVVMIFGPQYFKEDDLERIFGHRTALFTLLSRKGPAVGAFGWPEPQVGNDQSWRQVRAFYDRAKTWPASIPVAYPRFEDIYKQAGIGPGYGEIRDDKGETFAKTFALAEAAQAPFIQLATWNDWGEGTQVEPSTEFGYRDLEFLQKSRQQMEPTFPCVAADLRIPAQLYELRKTGTARETLDSASNQIRLGHFKRAHEILNAIPRHK